MFRNPKLYEHLKAAAKAASDLIKNEMPNSQQMEDLLKREPSVASCVRYLMEDASIERLNCIENLEEKTEEITRTVVHHVKNYLGNPCIDIIYEIDTRYGEGKEVKNMHGLKEFNEQSFNVYYEEYEKFLYSSSPIKYCIVAPLGNFDYASSNSAVIPSGSIRILPASDEFYVRWEAKYAEEAGVSYCNPEFLLEIDYEMERGKVPSKCKEHIEFVAREKVEEVLKILRLFKEGDLRWSWLGWFPKTPCDPPYSDDILLHFCGKYETQNKYSLQEGEVEGLRLLYQKYINTSDKKDFPRSAIECFNKGIKENDLNDKLVDFVRALESLLAPGRQEIRDKLANRVTFFLEENPQKRQEIFKDVQKAYSLRSHISHGDIEKVDELECRDYAKKMERYARRAISLWLEMIEKGYRAEGIYETIDSKHFGM